MSELARRYAQALWAESPDQEVLEETARALTGEPALWEALCSPAVQPEEKRRVLARLPLWAGREPLLRFYGLLADKGRMALLPEVLEAFRDQALAARGCARCVMTCARAPGEGELERLGGALCALHHKRDVQFEVRVEPALLGGFTLTIEGVTYDKSVRGALADLKRQLEARRMA